MAEDKTENILKVTRLDLIVLQRLLDWRDPWLVLLSVRIRVAPATTSEHSILDTCSRSDAEGATEMENIFSA